jgi:hypothetical protein
VQPPPLTCALQPGRGRAIEFWREHKNAFAGEALMDVLGPLLDERWVLYSAIQDGGFSVAGFGAHHTKHVGKRLQQRGSPLHPTGNESFLAGACVKVYSDVTVAFEPCPDELDAVSHLGRLRPRAQPVPSPHLAV